MVSVQTITKLAGSENTVKTQNMNSLRRLFRIMQDETLQTPAAKSLEDISNRVKFSATHRLFVHVYSFERVKETPTGL